LKKNKEKSSRKEIPLPALKARASYPDMTKIFGCRRRMTMDDAVATALSAAATVNRRNKAHTADAAARAVAKIATTATAAEDLISLAEEENKLEAWAAQLQAQALELEGQRAVTRAARAAAQQRAEREAELQAWAARLQAQVLRAVALLDAQRRDELDKCASFDEGIVRSIAALESMRAGVQRRAEALDSSYSATAHRMCVVAEEALVARRAQLEADFPPAQRCPNRAYPAKSAGAQTPPPTSPPIDAAPPPLTPGHERALLEHGEAQAALASVAATAWDP
jgi:hypothetical protein